MPAPQSSAQRQQTIGQVAPSLTAGSTAAVIASLVAVGVSTATAHAALTLLGESASQALPLGLAARAAATSEQIYRAAFLVAAAERIQSRVDSGMTLRAAVVAERPMLTAHRAAVTNRRNSAVAVDAAGSRFGSVLGWSARMDAKTSAECARANGRNFSVTSRPVIGWPGSVHPHCRCRPVAPFAGAGFVDDVATVTERREAVA